jgi:ABC-type nitrate/sulfonate/bicarbonate transport system substrate-binding protein
VSSSLTVGSFTPSVLLALARDLGHLDAHGVVVEEVPVPSSPAQFRALLDGELDVAFTSPDNVLAYRFSPRNPLGATADVTIVSAVDRGMGLGIYARPGLGAEALHGATVGVDVPTSGFALALYALADSLGVARDQYDLVALGSTPQRLRALLAGSCDVTMLNAGNELLAEDQGCTRLAAVADVCRPYLGTVLSVAGTRTLSAARDLAAALRVTAVEVVGGRVDEAATAQAQQVLGLTEPLAHRYVERCRDPREGLVADGRVDLDALATLVGLRRRYLPDVVDGVDTMDGALAAGSGLVTAVDARV